jgi:hypothetical protein
MRFLETAGSILNLVAAALAISGEIARRLGARRDSEQDPGNES